MDGMNKVIYPTAYHMIILMNYDALPSASLIKYITTKHIFAQYFPVHYLSHWNTSTAYIRNILILSIQQQDGAFKFVTHIQLNFATVSPPWFSQCRMLHYWSRLWYGYSTVTTHTGNKTHTIWVYTQKMFVCNEHKAKQLCSANEAFIITYASPGNTQSLIRRQQMKNYYMWSNQITQR